MRKYLNKLLNPLGYNLVRQSRLDNFLAKAVQENKEFVFVQVGANDGVRFDSLYQFVTKHRCSGLVIEPIKEYFDRLVMNYKDYKSIVPINLALHPTKSSEEIHYVNPALQSDLPDWSSGIGSFNPEHHKKSRIPSEVMTTEVVKCEPLMKVLSDNNISHIDLLQIDVEGFDAEIIKMIDLNEICPRIIKFEHCNLNEESKADCYRLLEANGYQIYPERRDTIAAKKVR